MATLILGAAGAAAGSVFGGIGLVLGRAAGAVAGNLVDGALFGAASRREGPRLSDLSVQSSTEGSPIPRLYGASRLAGQMIWATDFEEKKKTNSQGGKGGPSVTTTEYSYFANFALALCEGPITRIGRIWADGKPLDQPRYTIRIHRGGEDQQADSLILARQGGKAPAYRGTAYVVFERMPLADFGNRIPQLTFEVFRAVPGLEDHVRAVCLIPGTTEFGYDPEPVRRKGGRGLWVSENAHAARGISDWSVSLDELQALCPNLEWVTLVVAWFGDDLRCGHCTVRPKVDDALKTTPGKDWKVSGLTRGDAAQVSRIDGRPAFGGTPDDDGVVRAIDDLGRRGLKVALAPFLMMDIPAGNTLPDPRTGSAGQPAYPWRGDIGCDPAAGAVGSVDKTAAAAAQAADFLGTAAPGDFAASGGSVVYSGPAEWRYRRMVLHYARLAALAGGVDAFLVGSELRGLTTIRSGTSDYPFVDGLRTLAADARSILGPGCQVSYAADWSEYFGHQPVDGSGDVHFHLDPFWAEADFIGIDLYHPLADWRDEPGHLDEALAHTPYSRSYLRAGIRGGEGFDWFYASDADRKAQLRSPISDGAYGKDWVFRFKDIEAWWASPHHDRPGGAENAAPTAWVPMGKPVWLTELGCPAVDKGANQPNLFPDPKSASGGAPHFSDGGRDDLAQRSYVDAYRRFLDPGHPGFDGSNPVSPLYGGRMIDPAHLHLWAWDARPYPHFPALDAVWSDGDNWATGHWLNGRFGALTLEALVAAILADHGFDDFRIEDVHGLVDGFVTTGVQSARATLEPLLQSFRIDAADAGDALVFRGRLRPADSAIGRDDLVDEADAPLVTRVRAQETELPAELVLRFTAPGSDYRMSAVAKRRLTGASRRTTTIDVPIVLGFDVAEKQADMALRDLWNGRETTILRLGIDRLAIEAGDIVVLPDGEPALVERIEDGDARTLHLRRVDNRMRAGATRTGRPPEAAPAEIYGPPEVFFVEYSPPDGDAPHAPRIAAFCEPWPGSVAVYSGAQGGGFALSLVLTQAATTGTLDAPLAAGPTALLDERNAVLVTLAGGTLAGLPEIDVLNGGNAAAIRRADGAWEILQFRDAELVGENRYRLTGLLRGQRGSEAAMGAAAGDTFLLLDGALEPLPMTLDELGIERSWRIGPARDDHAAPSYAALTYVPGGTGLKPFAPCHLAAKRQPDGSVSLAWIRRTRIGGDGWAAAEVPLGEAKEAYRVRVFAGGLLLREAETSEAAWLYGAAEQAADFGGPAGDFELEIVQLGEVAGAGFPLTETIHV